MKYIIDSGNRVHIEQALTMGINGVTANPSMYKNNNESFYQFIEDYSNKELTFLSGEVMGNTLDTLLNEVDRLVEINKDIVIKINFSEVGLQLCSHLSKKGIKTAMTLVFTIPQAVAAIQAGADYLFPFIGRNDEYGNDGLSFIISLQHLISQKGYPTKVIAASIKNLYQLEQIAKAGIDYAAVPYELYMKSLHHPLTDSGKAAFEEDWNALISK